MDISGTYTFNAPPDRVWDLLMDPAVISSCIPGCDDFEPDGEDRYRVKLTVALAAITGTYDGTVAITDKVPPSSYRLIGRRAGQARVRQGQLGDRAARRRRHDDRGRDGTVQTGGPIARVGQRLIGGVAKMMLDRFFACLQEAEAGELTAQAQVGLAWPALARP